MVGLLPGSDGEQPCPRCGALVLQSDRYPEYLCSACEDLATDADGVPVVGFNTHFSGGFMLRWPGGEHPDLVAPGAWVWIDGTRWWANEARFGGTLMIPELRKDLDDANGAVSRATLDASYAQTALNAAPDDEEARAAYATAEAARVAAIAAHRAAKAAIAAASTP